MGLEYKRVVRRLDLRKGVCSRCLVYISGVRWDMPQVEWLAAAYSVDLLQVELT
jgi:hypothetical protein